MTVANAFSQPIGHDPERGSAPSSRMNADYCDDASSYCESRCRPEERQTPKKRTIYFPNPVLLGDPARLNLAHTKGGHSPLLLRVDRTQCAGATQQKVRSTRGPCSPDAVQCTYSDCVRPSMTRRSPWSNVIREGTLPCPRRTLNSTELPKLMLTMTLGAFCGTNKGSLSPRQRIHELGPEYRFKFTPVGTSLLAHQGDKRRATPAPQTNNTMPDGVIGLWSDSCSMSILV